MSCRRIKHWINDYLEMRLLPEERQSLESHLRRCAQCRELVESMRLARTALRSLPQQQVSGEFWSQLQTRLPERRTGAVEGLSRLWGHCAPGRGNVWATAGVGIALAVALLVSPHLLQRESGDNEMDAPSAFVSQCVEQHAAYTGDQVMPDSLAWYAPNDSDPR